MHIDIITVMLEKLAERLGSKWQIYVKYFYLLLILLMVTSLVKNVLRARGASGRIEEARLRVEKLEKENEELVARLDTVQGDEFREKQIREGLGLARSGEIVMVLPEPEILRSLAPRTFEEENILPDPNWKKWLNLFL